MWRGSPLRLLRDASLFGLFLRNVLVFDRQSRAEFALSRESISKTYSLNMYGVCSVCLVQSPVELTPLFVNTGNNWESTGLLDMLESILEKRVMRQNESSMAACIKCIKRIILSFNNGKTAFSAEEKEKSELGKLKLEQSENEDFINMLDLTCLAKIFMYLPLEERLRMEKVCTKWKDASDLCWSDVKEFTVHLRREPRRQKKIRKIIRRCGYYLERLHVDARFDRSILITIKKHCQRLREFSITLLPQMINDDETNNLFSQMEKIKNIKIFFYESGGSFLDLKDYRKSLINILSSVPEDIEKLFLSGCSSHLNFPATLDKFNSLVELGIQHFSLDEDIMREISEKKTLKKLSLRSCLCLSTGLLTSGLPNLEELNFFLTDNNNCQALGSLIRNCRNLKKLYLGCSRNHISLGDISGLKQLEFLSLECIHQRMGDAEFAEITTSCKNLVTLNLSGGDNLSSLGLRYVAQLDYLEHLDLSSLINVDDAVMISIASNLNKIRVLDLSHCKGIGSLGLKNLGYLVNLEELYLRGVRNFNSDVIFSITNNCKKLKILDLSSARNISKKDLEKIANLENLENLYLALVQTVDDEIVQRIADKCQKMEKLAIGNCAVSPKALRELIRKCPNLKEMEVYGICLNVEIFKFAVDVTKCRTNNIVLTIIANENMINCFYKPLKEKSPLLKVTTIKNNAHLVTP